MICKLCGYKSEEGKVGFKAVCENCGEYLHSCLNCNLYDSDSGRCRSLTTEAVRDKKSNNYCEEFVPYKKEQPAGKSRERRSSKDFDLLFD